MQDKKALIKQMIALLLAFGLGILVDRGLISPEEAVQVQEISVDVSEKLIDEVLVEEVDHPATDVETDLELDEAPAE
jgi:hypothetical protein